MGVVRPTRFQSQERTNATKPLRGYPGSPEGASVYSPEGAKVNSPGRQPRDGERRATNPLRSPEGATEPMVPQDFRSPLWGFGGGGRRGGPGSRG